MEDAKRFLRYFVPGALFGLEAAILLWLLRPDLVEENIQAASSEPGFGFALAGLLGSGALGYLFSIVHHELHWRRFGGAIDHTDLIRSLSASNLLSILVVNSDGSETPLRSERIDRALAQTVLSAMWHGAALNTPTKNADTKVSNLSDTAHSAGTAAVASAAALAVSLLVAATESSLSPSGWPLWGFIGAVAAGAGCTFLFWRTYRRVGLMAQSVIDQVFLDAVHSPSLGRPKIVRFQSNQMLR